MIITRMIPLAIHNHGRSLVNLGYFLSSRGHLVINEYYHSQEKHIHDVLSHCLIDSKITSSLMKLNPLDDTPLCATYDMEKS